MKHIFFALVVWLLPMYSFSNNLSNGSILTILTQSIGDGKSGYTGHYAVTRSLLEGLHKIGVPFKYNPRRIEDVTETVYVLSDINALYQAIDLKRAKKIKKLLAGPCIMVRSNEFNRVLASPEIDTYIVNSEWTYKGYIEDEPSLENRLKIWYVGVDVDYWQPMNSRHVEKTNNVLVYWKTESEGFCQQVEDTLRRCNFNPMRIRYGSYSKEQYKQVLTEVDFAVFISRSESQGIALAEAWSMDIPTLVWDPQEPFVVCNKLFWPISAAPYLNKSVGISWKNMTEFEETLSAIRTQLEQFSPRDWVSKNMSDEVSAQLLLTIVQNATGA
ncbi:MAG: hypothetical protein NTX86_01260 [Candidatus Dependentiae bacterium]|nr:hypothetical protein [Candidatus Dependentiae bacterium]